MTNQLKICSQCIMDTSDSLIRFNNDGLCEYCLNFKKNIFPNWSRQLNNKKNLDIISEKIKKNTRGNKYNCIIGISGGVDSSYVVHIAKTVMNLNPLLFHVDAGWNSIEAVSNIEKLIDKLKLDLHTEVVDWDEMRDLQLSFFKAGVPHLDTPQDHAFFAGLYNFARKYNFKYILTGANFSTESVREPLEWHYHATDLRHLLDIQKKFGVLKLKNFPLTDIFKYKIFYRYFDKIQIVKPLNYVDYEKNKAINLLESRYGWMRYPHKHYESKFTSFYEGYWLKARFGFDKRKAHYSSLILSNQMKRSQALDLVSKPMFDDLKINNEMQFISSKLNINISKLQEYFRLPLKSYKDYKNNAHLINLGTILLTKLGINNTVIR